MLKNIANHINENFKITESNLEKVLCVLFSGGHLLLTDEIGTGKTTLSKIIADMLSLEFQRIQFTSDVTPGDITGFSVYNMEKNVWELHKGPVFTNVLLADEINRAPGRTHSGLLEAMAEKQVTIDRHTYTLSENYLVIGTQNPLNEKGVFELPLALKDRFMMNLSLNHLDEESEKNIISGLYNYQKKSSVLSEAEFINMKKEIELITVPDDVIGYTLSIIKKLRNHKSVIHPASLRCGQDLVKAAKVLSMLRNDKKVLPDHIYELIDSVISHRIITTLGSDKFSVVKDLLENKE